MNKAEKIRRRRLEIKRHYGVLYDRLNGILFAEDPIDINFEGNTDEYEPEVETILPRLRSYCSAEDVKAIVHEEFVRLFNADLAGPAERYQDIADRIWREVIPEMRV